MPRKRRARGILIAAALCLALASSAARGRTFTLYAQAFLDSTHVPSARVTAEVPFKSLVFFKKNGLYDARYEVYVEIDPAAGDEHGTHTSILRGRAVANSYGETSRIDRRSKTSGAFELAPGKYHVSATVRIHRTSVAMKRSLELVVPDFLATGIGFGSPVAFLMPPGHPPAFARWNELDVEPPAGDGSLDTSTAVFDRRPAVRFQLFVEGGVSRPVDCDIFYEVVGANDEQVLYGRREVELEGDREAFVLTFDVDDWNPGTYQVNLRARTSNPTRDTSASVKMNIDVTRAMLYRDFDDTMEMLSLIASKDELTGLRLSTPQNRVEEWSKFWAERDPDRTTPENEALEEHLRRVRHVNKVYSRLGPGWRSDRGQVYIRYGEPARVERTSDNRNQGDYEIWRYATGRVFVFYDMFGLGDYRLVQGDMF
jgi:GWxTD domain-containing protein